MDSEHEEERNFPFDRVLVIGQLDGTWITVYIRKGFRTQKKALEDVSKFLGMSEINWKEFYIESEEADLSPFMNEADERIETDFPEFMREFFKEEDE